jgi:hypothetical protein
MEKLSWLSRNFYKDQRVYCGRVAIDALDDEAQRKIERQVINSRGEIFFSKLMVLVETITSDFSFDDLLSLNCFFTLSTVISSASLNINQGIFNDSAKRKKGAKDYFHPFAVYCGSGGTGTDT